jgi:hypothetical protein
MGLTLYSEIDRVRSLAEHFTTRLPAEKEQEFFRSLTNSKENISSAIIVLVGSAQSI